MRTKFFFQYIEKYSVIECEGGLIFLKNLKYK